MVSKCLVLLVRQASVRLSVIHFLALNEHHFSGSQLVHVIVVPSRAQRQHGSHYQAHQQRQLCRFVLRRILRAKCFRPNDVSDGKRGVHHGHRIGALRMPGDVAGYPLVYNVATAGKGVDEVQAREEAGLVVRGEKGEQAGAEDAEHGCGEDDEVPLAVVAHVHGVRKSAHDVYSARGHVEESRNFRRVAEGGEYGGAVGADNAGTDKF